MIDLRGKRKGWKTINSNFKGCHLPMEGWGRCRCWNPRPVSDRAPSNCIKNKFIDILSPLVRKEGVELCKGRQRAQPTPPNENSTPLSLGYRLLYPLCHPYSDLSCNRHPLQSLGWGGEEAPVGQLSSSQDQELLGKGQCTHPRSSLRNPQWATINNIKLMA